MAIGADAEEAHRERRPGVLIRAEPGEFGGVGRRGLVEAQTAVWAGDLVDVLRRNRDVIQQGLAGLQ